ncbi:hypothetical protein BYT27DRAFT_7221675 [Phlegmacium glaucopus]|nr:hypothetical protein BYT27DRAFT_7221675 [Phlegmacium glaucopus]
MSHHHQWLGHCPHLQTQKQKEELPDNFNSSPPPIPRNARAQPENINYHPIIDATPCNSNSIDLPPNTPPPPRLEKLSDDWTPWNNRVEYELAQFLYKRNQMANTQVNVLLDLWAASLLTAQVGKPSNAVHDPPFADVHDMHAVIDSTELEGVSWESFSVEYSGDRPDVCPEWMDENYEVWYRDPAAVARSMLKNPDFAEEFDYKPFRKYDAEEGREYKDFMSGNWAWEQADIISEDPATHGSMFVPIILGSDKTTISVATGQNEYYLLYMSIGNIKNNVRRAHRNSVILIGFLSIPKTTRQHSNTTLFRKFHHQLFHSSLSAILQPLCAGMTTPEVLQCPDQHFRHAIFGLGPYIADYPEQVLLGCIVQNWCPRCTAHHSNLDGEAGQQSKAHRQQAIDCLSLADLWDDYGIVGDIIPFMDSFPRADINQLLSPDLLHQVINGGFKDHLVTWVGEYLDLEHGSTKAKEIMDDIDRRIALAPSFPGLRCFPQGQNFKQWTGDDSKALMKVYINAIEGHVPQDMVRTLVAYLDFCYLVQRAQLTERTLQEAKHIKAVKEPWRRSSHYNALGQMLVTNQRLDKLAAAHVDFTDRGMLNGSCLQEAMADYLASIEEESEGLMDDQRGYPKTLHQIGVDIDIPSLHLLTHQFLGSQVDPNADPISTFISPIISSPIKIFHFALFVLHAPSDPSGMTGMRREYAHSTPLWRQDGPRRDCVFVTVNPDAKGMRLGMLKFSSMRWLEVGRVLLCFSFVHETKTYPCALVHWFPRVDEEPDADTEFTSPGKPALQVIHIDTIARLAHLLPIFGQSFVPVSLHFSQTLDSFHSYYISKYADHNTFDITTAPQ